MFLISGVIIIIVLIMLKLNVNLPEIIKSKREMEARFEQKTFRNIVDEMLNAGRISIHQEENITTNIHDFANFTRTKSLEKGYDFEMLFVGVQTPQAADAGVMNVTILNFVGQSINASLLLNSSFEKTNETENQGIWTSTYQIASGSNYTITIGYNNTYKQNMTVRTRSGRRIYVGYYDIILRAKESMNNDRFQDTFVLD